MIIDGLNFKFYVNGDAIEYGAVRRIVRERGGNRPPIVKYQFLDNSPYTCFPYRAAHEKYFHDELTEEQKKAYAEKQRETELIEWDFKLRKTPGAFTEGAIQEMLGDIRAIDADAVFEECTSSKREYQLGQYRRWRDEQIAMGNSGRIPGDTPETE